jgi:hypothetical protein
MPYSVKDTKKLPSYVQKLSPEARAKWVAIFNAVFATEGESMAFAMANKWVKEHIKKKETMARTEHVRSIVEFEVDMSQDLIQRTADGEEYISFKLADTFKDKFGVEVPPEVLQRWADAINSGQAVLGDVDHEYMDKLQEAGYSIDQVKSALKSKPSIAKAVKAVYEKGRLWVRALIDKRYKKLIQESKGVSMEALVTRDDSGRVTGGDLLGFTFAVKHNPVIQGTEVVA